MTKGAFQIYALRWIGSNEDPDIFRYAYGTGSFPPKGGNRGRYSNARVDALLTEAAAAEDRTVRKADYVEVQRILADELPSIPMWYPNNEVVHTRRITNVRPRASGTFDFLTEAEVAGDMAGESQNYEGGKRRSRRLRQPFQPSLCLLRVSASRN